MKLYTIIDWDKNFEFAQSRKVKGALSWVKIPGKFDGDGITELLDHEDGAAHYGAWVSFVLIGGRCKPRGVLMRDNGRPYCPRTLSRVIGISATVIQAMLDRVADEEIKWVNVSEYEPSTNGDATSLVVGRDHRDGTTNPMGDQHIRLEESRLEEMIGEETGPNGLDFSRIIFPGRLDTPEVRQAINRWIDHLTIRNMPPFDPEQHIGFALKRFTGKQPREFIEQVEWSIEAGTMKTIAGPRPERQNNNSGGSRPITAEEVVERLRVGREEDERRAEYQEQGQGKGDIPI